MIEPEDAVSVKQARELIPGRPDISTIHRWINKGLDGVKLKSVKAGGKRFTTKHWLNEFFAELSGATSQQMTTASGIQLLDDQLKKELAN